MPDTSFQVFPFKGNHSIKVTCVRADLIPLLILPRDPTHLASTKSCENSVCVTSRVVVSQPTAYATLLQNPVIQNARKSEPSIGFMLVYLMSWILFSVPYTLISLQTYSWLFTCTLFAADSTTHTWNNHAALLKWPADHPSKERVHRYILNLKS